MCFSVATDDFLKPEVHMSQRKIVLTFTVSMSALLILLSGCGLFGSNDNPTDGGQVQVQVLGPGESASLVADAGYHIVPYYAANTEGSTGYSLNLAAASSQVQSAISAGPGMGTEVRSKWRDRLALDELLHQRRAAFARSGAALEQGLEMAHALKNAAVSCTGNTIERGGSCVDTFTLVYDISGSKTVTVKVRGVGSKVAVAVDADDNAGVADGDVSAIVSKFDGIILPRDESIFGSPIISGTDYADVDGNGLRLIVLTHLVKQQNAVGFFNPNDMMAPAKGGNGNQTDMLWIVTPGNGNTLESIYGTVAHEYFHLIHYAIKTMRYGVEEEVFLSESLAHLAEDAAGFGMDDVDAVWSYLDAADKITWAFGKDSVEKRGMGYLFVRYMFEQKGGVTYSGASVSDEGGAAFLKKVVDTKSTGFDAVNAALGGGWAAYFPKWIATVTLDGLGLTTSKTYSYTNLYSDSETGQMIGACTHCTRKNAAGQDITLAGFTTGPASGAGEGTVDATGLVSLEYSPSADTAFKPTADSNDVGFVVVRLK
jgi:hypothetical protein